MFDPAIMNSPEKLECTFLHLPVFESQMLFHDRSAILHPDFIASSRNLDLHGPSREDFLHELNPLLVGKSLTRESVNL
jgi:hypothetical protein